MFEDSTFESGGRIKSGSGPWMIPMFIAEAAFLILMVLIPLIYPEALPKAAMQMALVAPPPPPSSASAAATTRGSRACGSRAVRDDE
jgi:protein TonB